MKSPEIQVASNQDLVKRYNELATTRGVELETGSPKAANRAFDEEVLILRELDRREPDGPRLLLPLLKSPNPWVRMDAATRTLFFAREEAETVLEELATRQRALGFTAKWTLKEWREGKLKAWWRKNAGRDHMGGTP